MHRVFEKSTRARFSGAREFTSGSFALDSLPAGPLSINIESLHENIIWGDSPPYPGKDDGWLVREAEGEFTW